MRLGFRIAIKFLKSNKGQTFLIILGIAIGVSVQIFIGSLIQGLQKSLIDKTIGNSSQITITSKNEDAKIHNYTSLVNKIQATDSAITHIAVTSDHATLFQYKEQSKSLYLRGFEFEQANGIYHIIDQLTQGRLPKGKNEILLGIDLQNEYNLQLNDQIELTTSNQTIETCTIVGFFDLKVASLNSNWAITTLDNAQSMFDTGDTVTSIELQVNNNSIFLTDELSVKIEQALQQDDLSIVNWKEQNESLLSGLQGQSISSYMIQVFVMISVILGIASVLAITVLQKSKQIGILKAMGIRNSSTRYIFLFEGLILGFFGALLGILLGLLLSFSFTKFALNTDGTPVVALYLNYRFIMLSGVIAVFACVLAALIPAIRSSKLNPIDIIRNN
ncbi:MAG: ABC transporter permease [Velocimicrobium sp.]